MKYNLTDWEFSHTEAAEPEYAQPIEGDRTLRIVEAVYNPEDTKYMIKMQDLENNATFFVSYWLKSLNKATGEYTPNNKSIGTLTTLGNALFFGSGVTVPNANDIIGGVVTGRVKFQPDKTDPTKKYPRIYEFFPVPKDIAILSDIDQYWIGREEEAD